MQRVNSVPLKVLRFFKAYSRFAYRKGHLLIKDSFLTPDIVYFLEKGQVAQIKRTKDKKEIILNIFKPGSFFPLIFALGNMNNSFDFEALSPIEVRSAPLKDVILFLQKNPDVMYDFINRLSRGTVGLLNHLTALISHEAEEQIIFALTVYVKRFGKKEGKLYRIDLALTHKGIANHLGLSRETVTRELKKLLIKKTITKKGKFYYLPEKLYKGQIDLTK